MTPEVILDPETVGELVYGLSDSDMADFWVFLKAQGFDLDREDASSDVDWRSLDFLTLTSRWLLERRARNLGGGQG